MKQMNHWKRWRGWTVLLSCLVFFLPACSFHFSAGAKTGGSSSSKSEKGDAKGSAQGNGDKKSTARVESSTRTKSSGGASLSGKASGSGKSSVKKGAKGKGGGAFSTAIVFKSKDRVKLVGRSKKGDSFHATGLVRGGARGKGTLSGSAQGGGRGSAGSNKGKGNEKDLDGKDSVEKDEPTKTDTGSAQVTNKKRPKTSSEDDKKQGKKPDKKNKKPDGGKAEQASDDGPDSKKPAKPRKPPSSKKPDGPDEKPDTKKPDVVEVIDPPEEPPENVFGYEDPVRGCFEGVVYPLRPRTRNLPQNFGALTGISVVYACEWDIAPTKWSLGFPGVQDRYEWFAIRYSGSFSVEEAGKWTFRISSDDGAKLYIDGKLVVDNDGVHEPAQKKKSVFLSKGDHEMVLEYFQGPRFLINLQLYATPPGGQEGVFSVR